MNQASIPQPDLRFHPAELPPEAFSYRTHMREYGLSKPDAKRVVARLKEERILTSTTHQLNIHREPHDVYWISIKRRDRQPILDRLELGAIVEAVAPDRVGLELLPDPERAVDVSNQYHAFAVTGDHFVRLQRSDAVEPPHLGDWRLLYAWSRAQFGTREAALVLNGSLRGRVILAPEGHWFPFGFRSGAVADVAAGQAVQRPFSLTHDAQRHRS